jgi:hypothetical protein
MTFYGMLENNTETVDVVVISNLGTVDSATFDIFGVCDETGAYDAGYADGAASCSSGDWEEI